MKESSYDGGLRRLVKRREMREPCQAVLQKTKTALYVETTCSYMYLYFFSGWTETEFPTCPCSQEEQGRREKGACLYRINLTVWQFQVLHPRYIIFVKFTFGKYEFFSLTRNHQNNPSMYMGHLADCQGWVFSINLKWFCHYFFRKLFLGENFYFIVSMPWLYFL